jgi:uncharacterized protein HemX
MDKIKNQLAGVAALLGVIAAIGGGFVKYGEITTKLESLESQEWAVVDTTDIETSIAVLEEKVEKLENRKQIDTSGLNTNIKINSKEIELLKVQIEEIKVKSSNPLAN